MFICLTDIWGGIEKNVVVRSKALEARGYKVAVAVLSGTFEERFESEGVPVFSIPKGGRFRLSERAGIARLIKELKPRAVFSALKADWWLVAQPAYRSGVQSIVLYLGIERTLKQNIKYCLLFQKFSAQLLVNSYSLKRHILATNRFLSETNVSMIHNGFQVREALHEDSDLELPALPQSAFVIGCAGRLAPTKQYHLLAKILPKLPQNVHVLLAGEGAERLNVERALMEAGVSERVHVIGQLEYKYMPVFFSKVDMFLHLSRLEGMANVLNEALSNGVPVVSSRTSGADEATDNGRLAILTEIGDVNAAVDGIKQIMDGEFEFNPQEARQWIIDNFSLERMIDETESLLFRRAASKDGN